MPVIIVHGVRPGPTVWVDAAVHGDEINGIAVARRCVGAIEPRRLAGTVLIVPVVNVFGVAMGSRYLPDRRDLNRCFPGTPRGSLGGQLAHLFFDRVVSRCEVGIDIHSASNGRDNLLHLRANLDDPITRRCAEAFGAPLAMHSVAPSGSLRGSATRRGKTTLVVEVGEALRIDPRSVDATVAGVRRVLHCLSMLPVDGIQPSPTQATCRRTSWVRASRSGFCLVEVGLGDHVQAGQQVAWIMDTLGKKDAAVRARKAGIVVSLLRTAMVHRGDALVHIAEDAVDHRRP